MLSAETERISEHAANDNWDVTATLSLHMANRQPSWAFKFVIYLAGKKFEVHQSCVIKHNYLNLHKKSN